MKRRTQVMIGFFGVFVIGVLMHFVPQTSGTAPVITGMGVGAMIVGAGLND